MELTNDAYERCPSCAEAREGADLTSALRCHPCRGTGVVRRADSFRCNRCGGTMGVRDEARPHGLVEQTVSGGYSSEHLLDTTTYTFSLCEACLRRLFDECVVPPTIGAYMGGPAEQSYAEERVAYEWHAWRRVGGHRPRVREGRCNQVVACDARATLWMVSSHGLTDEVACEGHGGRCGYSNYYAASYAEAASADAAGARSVADLWFCASAWPAPTVTAYRYVPEVALEAVGVEDDRMHPKLSAIWAPSGSAPLDHTLDARLTSHTFQGGVLLVGPADVVRDLRHPNLRAVSVLNRHVELDEDE